MSSCVVPETRICAHIWSTRLIHELTYGLRGCICGRPGSYMTLPSSRSGWIPLDSSPSWAMIACIGLDLTWPCFPPTCTDRCQALSTTLCTWSSSHFILGTCAALRGNHEMKHLQDFALDHFPSCGTHLWFFQCHIAGTCKLALFHFSCPKNSSLQFRVPVNAFFSRK